MTITRMQEPRQLYGLGSLVKKITKPIKKIVKSPIGKAALLGAAAFGIPGTQFGGLLGRASFGGAAKGLLGNFGLGQTLGITGLSPGAMGGKSPGIFNALKRGFGNLGTGTKLGIAGGLLTYLGSQGLEEQEIEEIKQDPGKLRIYLRDYFSKLNPNASDAEIKEFVETNVSEYATGGRVGFKEGMNMKMASMDENEREFMRLVEEFMERGFNQQEAIEAAREEFDRKAIATGGRVGYASGFGVTDYAKSMNSGRGPITLNDFIDIYKFAGYDDGTASSLGKKHYKTGMGQDSNTQGFAMGGSTDEKVIMAAGIEGLPVRQNKAGVKELDLRETGGFIQPVGIKEKADDIPAMLSNNEFVFTADAVRAAGGGDVDKGAQLMYDTMKKLESKVV